MKKILLQKCLPKVFASLDIKSELWQQECIFSKGESYLIKADSGKGKSSFCSYIMGYRGDYCGDIFFNETNINGFDAKMWSSMRQNHLAYLPQGLMLFNDLTAIDNILLKNSITNYKDLKWIHNTAEKLGIPDRLNFEVGKLSYGQKQRVAIIRALCQPFDFILLDEPVSHIDDNTAVAIANLLKEELKNNGGGVICTSIGKEICFEYDKIIKL